MVSFGSKIVIARKEHRCCYCGCKINSGTSCVRWDSMTDSFSHCYAHEKCDKLVKDRKYLEGKEEFMTDDVQDAIVCDCRDNGIKVGEKPICDLVITLLNS